MAFSEHPQHTWDDRGRCLVLEPEKNHTGQRIGAHCQKISEVQIARDDEALLLSSFLKNQRVRQALKALFAQMPNIVTMLSEGMHRAQCNAHIRHTFHKEVPVSG